jgi:DNA polymerase I
MITLDTETEEIVGNPLTHPPAMYGLAYHMDAYPPGYLHFRGEKSNSKFSEVGDFLQNIWNSNEPLLFHNAPFDLSVICSTFNLPMPHWSRIHDTMYLVYLSDPYAATLSLKPSAERYLDLPADEQDELNTWLKQHGLRPGADIVKAPIDLISKYAIGDVVRTRQLFDKLWPILQHPPYDRERELMPILLEGTRRGLRVARGALEEAAERATATLEHVANRVRTTLAAPNLNLSSPAELASALEAADAVTHFQMTAKGNRSVAKKALATTIRDPELIKLLRYHSSLETCLGTFMTSWLAMSEEDGRVHPEWNQVRNTEDKKRLGTRTGRISCSKPNLTNVPTEFEQEIPEGLPPLPFMRQFLLPEEGHLWLKRDYSSQEIRIAAHFEDGPLLAAYKENPDLDPHQMAKDMILRMLGKDFSRKHVKITGFQIIYGGGANAISTNVGCSYEQGVEFKEAYFTAMPGIRALSRDTNNQGRNGLPITTWGGRTYFKEPSKLIKGRMVDFSYKLLNYLIQGSAADQTKDAIIRWHREDPQANFLVQVYDEVGVSAPIEYWKTEMARLKRIMEEPLLDCPMLTEGFVGENWHDITKCE